MINYANFLKLFFSLAAWLVSGLALCKPVEFNCDQNVNKAEGLEAKNHEEQLWLETLSYLSGVYEILTVGNGCSAGPLAVVQTNDGNNGIQRNCAIEYEDIQKTVKHLGLIINNPQKAKKCFDTQKDYSEFQLYSPNKKMKKASPISNWLDRPTLDEYFEENIENTLIIKAGLELSQNFERFLESTTMPEYLDVDITHKTLKELWSSVGWLPFYAENSDAINSRFRGGYVYAEVMGPWGLLRISHINGEVVGAEIGMTVQLNDTFYPYHYHHPQEFYMPLSSPQCNSTNKFFVAHWDSKLFDYNKEDNEISFDGDKSIDVPAWFITQAPDAANFTYFERNAVHAFKVAENCASESTALVSLWGRTTSRNNNQTTRICSLEQKSSGEASSDDGFVCRFEKYSY